MTKLPRLKKRSDFLRVSSARRSVATRTLIVQICDRFPDEEADGPPVRVGFTSSRKVGNAVCRNKARRRLRAVAQLVFSQFSWNHHDVVLIARKAIVDVPYQRIVEDCRQAIEECLKKGKI